MYPQYLKKIGASVAIYTIANCLCSPTIAQNISIGNCSNPEPRGFNLKVGDGEVTVVGHHHDIIEFHFDGLCFRDYIRDGNNLGPSDVSGSSGNTRIISVRHGNHRDLVRVYAVPSGQAPIGFADPIRDGDNINLNIQGNGTVDVVYGRLRDLRGTYTFHTLDKCWSFLGSRDRRLGCQ